MNRALTNSRRVLTAGACVASLAALLGISATSYAVSIVGTGPELFTTGIGDYYAVAGNVQDSSPGLVLEVLGGSLEGSPNADVSLQKSPHEDGINMCPNADCVTMGQIRQLLEDQGILSTSSLVFGFGLNESGTAGTEYIDITTGMADTLSSPVNGIEFTIGLPASQGGGTAIFDLDPPDNPISVTNYQQGQSTAEAKIQIDLGFDILAEYTNSSTEEFTIAAYIGDANDGPGATSDGFEIIFLSGGFTENAPRLPSIFVPEPTTALLMGLGLTGLARFARTRRFID